MRWSACLLLGITLGCGSATGPQLGSEFSLRTGQSTSIVDIGLWVRFIGVAQDSRCPTTVQCVWAGDGAVILELAPLGGDSKRDTLHTTLEPRALDLGRTELRLVRLDPYPTTVGSIPPDAYVVRLATRVLP